MLQRLEDAAAAHKLDKTKKPATTARQLAIDLDR